MNMNMNHAPQASNNEPSHEDLKRLDLHDQDDQEIIENLDLIKKETLEKYPTPMSIVDDYRNGFISYGTLTVAFTSDEIEEIRNECDIRNKIK